MNPLCLRPLPSCRYDDPSDSLMMEREGFVDESVVTAIMCGSRSARTMAYPDDLALAADDLDFAGWRFDPKPPRAAEVPPQVIDAVVRRASPPVVSAGGTRPSSQSGRCRWLAGLAGVFSTLLVAGGLHLFSRDPEVSLRSPLPVQNPESTIVPSETNNLSLLGR